MDNTDKSYNKEAEEFARKRVDYEMSYTFGMDFTEVQKEWIKEHIYTSVKNAYQDAINDWKDSQEDIDYDTGVIGDKVLDRPLTEKPEEVAIYRTEKDKKLKFPCQSCTKVDKECIPTDFEGGGCGECPKYEDRVWANILKNKEVRSQFEINKEPEKDRIITNKELSMWLSKGNGQFLNKRARLIGCNHVYYATDYDFEIDYLNIRVRKWEDNEWHEPTYNYCFGDN